MKRLPIARLFAIAGSAIAVFRIAAGPADAQDVHGAGSTFVAPIIEMWASDYAKASGVRIEYESVGSGLGIQRIETGEIDFGATDKPLTPEELAKYGLCQFPIVIGGVVPVVNLPGIAPGQMKFSGALLADIFMNRITRWDAPEIRALNPGLKLPSMPISVVHRSDGSGTTYNWVDFLAKSSRAWKDKVGVGLAVNWPVGVGGKGNAGVAAAVLQTQGAVGYVEYSYAVQNRMTFTQVENSYGLFITPSSETFQSAADGVDWRDHQDFSVLMTYGGGSISYPITATSFILMYKSPKTPIRSAAALAFFKWALEHGEKQAAALNYAPLPPNLILLIKSYWGSHISK